MSAVATGPGDVPGRGRRLDVAVEHPRLIRVSGALDEDTAPMLAGVLRPVATRGGTVQVDLAGLEGVDASGFAVLLDIAHAIGRRGRLVLRDPPPAIRRLIEENAGDDVGILTIDHR